MNTAYNLFKEAVELEKDNADYFVLQEFTDVSGRKVKADETHKEQFIQDYIAAAGYADAAFKKETKAKTKELLKVAKDNIDAFFINSGVATCDNLQSIYAPKVEQNKTNLDYLKQVISVMQMLGCTEQEAYFADVHKIFVEGFLSWNNTKYEWDNQTLLAHFQQDLKIEFEQVNDFWRICAMNTILSGK